jgi:predicted metal-dependent phosphoesterase TrpH
MMLRANRPRFADLHVHTSHSDGSCSPVEVVRAAHSVGLSALAITDHDTFSAVPIAVAEAQRLRIELIPAVEMTVGFEKRQLHMLAYFVRWENSRLAVALDDLKAGRRQRTLLMAQRLSELGLSAPIDAIGRLWPRAELGRRHLAEWLVRTSQAESLPAVFAQWLGDDRPACVPKPCLDWRVAIELVSLAGGVTALAHPPRELKDSALRTMTEAGMVGVEVEWPRLGKAQANQALQRAQRLGLIAIAGSDFHAPGKPGAWVGAITTSEQQLERLRTRAVLV